MAAELKKPFVTWCGANGLTPVTLLQEKLVTEKNRESEVWLARDTDGIFKVFKEMFDHKPGPMSEIYPREDDTLFRIHLSSRGHEYLPLHYGTVEIDGTTYLKKSFLYGQPLSDYCRGSNLLSEEDAYYILHRIAWCLDHLLFDRVLFLDLRPENILVSFTAAEHPSHSSNKLSFYVSFPDVGLSTFVENRDAISRAAISHPKYCPPETAFKNEASEKSIVFQLGLIAQELLTGIHPFDKFPDSPSSKDWWANCHRYIDPYDENDYPPAVKTEFIGRMIDLEPEKRPGLKECFEEFQTKVRILGGEKKCTIKRKGIKVPETENNCILFPARMGIVHRGHINFMSRILDLGYKLIVSIQRAYTSTEKDPIPKWLIMKMVARSLLELGYSKESFRIVLTPFYDNRKNMLMHFSMLPGIDEVIGVASSNPSVHALFEENPIITQQHVFGFEGSEYKDLSWGEFIRGAIKNDDYEIFKDYAALGIENILSFEEIRTMCQTRPEIVFVPGHVNVRLLNSRNETVVAGRVFKYSTPEESLIKHLQQNDVPDCSIIDPYSKNTKVLWNGYETEFLYDNLNFDGQDELITFKLN
jgi:serine/threonine protein kinase